VEREKVLEYYKSTFGLTELSPLSQSGDKPIQIQYWWDAEFSFNTIYGYVSVIQTNRWRRGVLLFDCSLYYPCSSKPVKIWQDSVMKRLRNFDLTFNEENDYNEEHGYEEELFFLSGGTAHDVSLQLVTTTISCTLNARHYSYFSNKQWSELSYNIERMMWAIARKEPQGDLRKELNYIWSARWNG